MINSLSKGEVTDPKPLNCENELNLKIQEYEFLRAKKLVNLK